MGATVLYCLGDGRSTVASVFASSVYVLLCFHVLGLLVMMVFASSAALVEVHRIRSAARNEGLTRLSGEVVLSVGVSGDITRNESRQMDMRKPYLY